MLKQGALRTVLYLSVPLALFCWLFYNCIYFVLQASPDTGWLIAAGDLIRNTGSVPRHDVFSWTHPENRWVAYQWLYEVIASFLASVDGLWLVGATSYLLSGLLLAFVLPLQWSKLGIKPWLTAVFLCAGINEYFFYVRPQVVSFFFMLFFLAQLEEHRQKATLRALLFLAPATILWANLHSFWIVGLMLIAAYTIFAGSARARIELAGSLLLSSLAVFLNPYGSELVSYILLYPGQTDYRIKELLPAFPPQNQLGWAFLLFAAVSSSVILLKRKELPLAGIFASLFATVAALKYVRYEPIAVLVNWPFLGMALALPATAPAEISWRRKAIWFVSVAAVVLSMWIYAIPTELEAEDAFNGGSTWNIRFIASHLGKNEKLFCDDATGSKLLYFRACKVFIDNRFDMYGKDFFATWHRMAYAKPGWQQLMKDYGITAIVIGRPYRALEQGLIQEDDAWLLVYADRDSSFWLSNSAAHRQELKSWKLDSSEAGQLELPAAAAAETAALKQNIAVLKLLKSGASLWAGGKREEALRLYQSAAAIAPQSTAAHHALIHAFAVMQDKESLLKELRQAKPLFREAEGKDTEAWARQACQFLLKKHEKDR